MMREYWLMRMESLPASAKTATDDFLQVFQVYILLVGGAKKSCFSLRSHSSLQWIILHSPQSSLSLALSRSISPLQQWSHRWFMTASLSELSWRSYSSLTQSSKLLDESGWNSPLYSLFGGSLHSIFYLSLLWKLWWAMIRALIIRLITTNQSQYT